MSIVGIVSIAFGAVAVISRSCAVVAPAAALDWLRKITSTNRPLRIAGITGSTLGGVLVWAGNSDNSGLANFLLVVGWIMVGVCATLMVLFPAAYRAIIQSTVSSNTPEALLFIRWRSVLGIFFGFVLIYFGVRAL